MALASLLHVSLLLVWILTVASLVVPPTNVILHCQNFNNVLEWNYDTVRAEPGLRFRVDIGSFMGLNGAPDVLWVEAPARRADVSFLSEPENGYFLSVTAVIGYNESKSSPPDGITFSYFRESPVNQKCLVDLPPMSVTAQRDDKVKFRFEHPSVFHHQNLTDATKKHQKLPDFIFHVHQERQSHRFVCKERVCEGALPVDPVQKKHCLNISGELEKISVESKNESCADPYKEPPPDYAIIYIVSVLFAVATLVCIFFMVYRKMTKPSATMFTLPIPPDNPLTMHVQNKEEVLKVDQVEPSSPTPLLPKMEEEDHTESTPTITSTNYDFRIPIGVPSENGDVPHVIQERPEYMEGRLDGDEVFSSEANTGYEKRSVLVELAPNEVAEGYRG